MIVRKFEEGPEQKAARLQTTGRGQGFRLQSMFQRVRYPLPPSPRSIDSARPLQEQTSGMPRAAPIDLHLVGEPRRGRGRRLMHPYNSSLPLSMDRASHDFLTARLNQGDSLNNFRHRIVQSSGPPPVTGIAHHTLAIDHQTERNVKPAFNIVFQQPDRIGQAMLPLVGFGAGA